jgi:hypothetical protein
VPAEPSPRPAPPAGAGKTTVDTASAVRRRLEEAGLPMAPSGAAGKGTEARVEAAEGEGARRPASAVPKQVRLATLAGGILLIAMICLLVGRLLRGDSTSAAAHAPGAPPVASPVASAPVAPTPAPPVAPAPSAPIATSGATAQGLEQARQLIARHETAQALAVLDGLRAAQPDNAEVLYLQAMVHFDTHRWADGVAAAQLALKKDPSLKSDPDLAKGIIRSLASDRGYERSQALLRSMGEPAMPFVREAARQDPSPKVRERAGELLGGARGGGRGWAPAHSSSGSSMFRR